MSDPTPSPNHAPAPKPKAPGKRGGRRPGAGRKPTVVTEATVQLDAAVDRAIGAKALDLVANLKRLADGGYQRVTQTHELASEVMREDVVRDADGNPRLDARGNPITASQPAFPDAKPGELVVTKDRPGNNFPKSVINLGSPDNSTGARTSRRRSSSPS